MPPHTCARLRTNESKQRWHGAAFPNSRPRGSPSGRAVWRYFRWPPPYRDHHDAFGRARYRAGAVNARAAPWYSPCSLCCSPSAQAVPIWMEGVGGIREALTGLLIGLALIVYPLYLGVKAYRLPAIYDITTIRSIRRASRRSRGCGRAMPIR